MDLDVQLACVGAPDDLIEVVLGGRPTIDANVLSHIRAQVMARAGASHRRGRPGVWRWAAVAAAALALAGVAAPPATLAWVRSMLRFVPGFGLVSSAQVMEGLAVPVIARGPGYTFVVDGVLANTKGTEISAHVLGGLFESPPVATLSDGTGHTYRFRGASWGWTQGWGSGILSFAPLRGGPRTLKLTIGWTPAVHVTIPLVAGPSLMSERSFGPSATHHGVTIAVHVERLGSASLVDVLAERVPPGTRAQQFYVGSAPPSLALGSRGAVALQPPRGYALGPLQSFTGPPLASAARVATVTVPVVQLAAPTLTLTVSLPVPARGAMPLHRLATVGPATVKVVQVRRLARDHLRITLAYAGAVMLATAPASVAVDGATMDAWATRGGRQGQMTTLEVAVPRSATRITLTITSPGLVVAGPWRLRVPIEGAPTPRRP